MTEEVLDEGKTNSENVEVPEGEQVSQPDPIEVAARADGWVSKEEWEAAGKNLNEWRSAREFKDRGELFSEIHKLKEANKQTSKAFKALVEHHKNVREVAVKEAIDRLKAEKKQALQEHDVERVFEIDDEIDRVRETKTDLPVVDIPEADLGPTITFTQWHKKNDWYQLTGTDETSRYADVVGAQFKAGKPNATEEEILEHVESRISKMFPNLFKNPNSKRVSEVNPRSEGKSLDKDTFKLTEDEEKACKMFVDSGVMTRKEYVDELKKLRG